MIDLDQFAKIQVKFTDQKEQFIIDDQNLNLLADTYDDNLPPYPHYVKYVGTSSDAKLEDLATQAPSSENSATSSIGEVIEVLSSTTIESD
jgi:hypothetical protein